MLWTLLPAAFPAVSQNNWRLIWSDEFNGPAGSPPDPARWTYDLGNNGGWGNQELETYTNSLTNAYQDGHGNLVIHVQSSSSGFTSARIKTQGMLAAQYGRIEARIKVPYGQGMWSAFWMLGQDITSVGWPQCGEIDVMENIGKEPSSIHGTVHGPGYSGGGGITGAYTLKNGEAFSSQFHTFAVQWSPDGIVFFVDGISYKTVTPASIPAGRQWVFDHPFFLLLNVAVGGTWPGSPDAKTSFPQNMLVDYVRAFQATADPAPVIGGVVDVASYGNSLAPGGLAAVFGTDLALLGTSASLFDEATGTFPVSFAGTTVFVNGASSPLIYVAPNQINFQVPWESLVGRPLHVEVMKNNVLGSATAITLSTSAPSVFSVNGTAVLTCTGSVPRAGSSCSLWGNGFGPTQPSQLDGVPASATTPAPTVKPCSLEVGSVDATVQYCGGAPGSLIYQLAFVYPSGVRANSGTTQAAVTVNGFTGNFLMPAPRVFQRRFPLAQ